VLRFLFGDPDEITTLARKDPRTRFDHSDGITVSTLRFPSGVLAVSLAIWSGQPKSMAVRPTSIAFAEELPVPGVLLSATEDDEASLILPPRTFNPGRVMRSIESGPERKFRLTKLLQRGGDFERVSFEES
jgi:hypothetical protein